MRIGVVFDSPYRGWTAEQHREQMEKEMAGKVPEVTEVDIEYQVGRTLIELGHEMELFGFHDDLREVIDQCGAWKPDLVVNCAESCGDSGHDYVVPALLETHGIRYTGTSPLGLLTTRDKAMSKKVLAYHGIQVPGFATWRTNEVVRDTPPLKFPLIVKPLAADASEGIAMASVVSDRDELAERVNFVHQRFEQPAIAEEFIEGRELYASVVGNDETLEILPLTELVFDKEKNAPEERIATQTTKWDAPYRRRKGIRYQFARPVSAAAKERIEQICRTAFGALWLHDYARIDLRLSETDEIWVLEANANPFIARGHEVANAADKAGMPYPQFIQRILDEAARRYARA
ncbi:MAG: ATP-grasp domain-containing protein [Gemmatimonadetes bacterium]|nr:ATP-grasp domain-containing protein [Gemmatimonadota bacterium]